VNRERDLPEVIYVVREVPVIATGWHCRCGCGDIGMRHIVTYQKTKMKRIILVINSLFCFTLGVSLVSAADGTWTKTDGNWSDATKWVGNVIADGAGSIAKYPKLSGANITLTLDSSRTIGGVNNGDPSSGISGGTFTIGSSGGSVLTLSAGSTPLLRALNGAISINVVLDGTQGVDFAGKNSGTPGVVTIGAANIYSGDTQLHNYTSGGPGDFSTVIKIGIADAIPHGAGKGIVQFPIGGGGNYAVLDLQTFDTTVNALEGSDGRVNSSAISGTVTLTVGDDDASGTFGGTIDDGGTGATVALTKIGNGTQHLTGQNTYTGPTTINAGALTVDGSGWIFSPVTVNGGVLGGSGGTIYGTVTVSAGGSIGAGNSAGILNLFYGMDLSAGGTNIWELANNSTATPGTDFDQIVSSGAEDVTDATLSIRFIGSATVPDGTGFWASDHSWLIISSASVTGNFKTIENGTNAAGSFYTTVDGSGVTLNFHTSGVVPPPPPTYPLITSISGAGTASVTVYYTNTLVGTNYVLRYNTNLSTLNWYTVGTKAAPGTSDSQTDTPPVGGPQRYYRVYYQYAP